MNQAKKDARAVLNNPLYLEGGEAAALRTFHWYVNDQRLKVSDALRLIQEQWPSCRDSFFNLIRAAYG